MVKSWLLLRFSWSDKIFTQSASLGITLNRLLTAGKNSNFAPKNWPKFFGRIYRFFRMAFAFSLRRMDYQKWRLRKK
jgi:hypothetical protein